MERSVIQTLMGCVGSVGFAVLFNVRGKKLWLITGASAMAWMAYVLCIQRGAGVFPGLLAATVIAALISEILARVVKAPVLMFLVPILIPLIPGGDLYRMMNCLVRGWREELAAAAGLVLAEAGAIALGIIISAAVMGILTGFRRK